MSNTQFPSDNFLLKNRASRKLYHDYAAEMPIFDYHCHLSPKDLAQNRQYKNLFEIWLEGDHYKWRAMRTAGVPEDYITGDRSQREKFLAWAETVPETVGNPLFHWTHLELKKPFGINDRLLSSETAESVWDDTEAMLGDPDFSSWGILDKMNVKTIITTDDPVDDLRWHRQLNRTDCGFRMFPAFRPDRALRIDEPAVFNAYLSQLEEASGTAISSWRSFLDSVAARHTYFHENGCRISDHALDRVVYAPATGAELESSFQKIRCGGTLTTEQKEKFATAFILEMGELNADRNWTMQLHIGALRNNSGRMLHRLGPDTGFDSISDEPFASKLSQLLNDLDLRGKLPKTVLYTLNPAANDVVATMIGNFQGDGIRGKLQFGPGWWFNDQKTGMLSQLTSLSNMGLLSTFIGMATDSRSLLSYPRHEYFRRVLCSLVGTWVEDGEVPSDFDLLGKMVRDICYHNSRSYFGCD